MEFVEKNPHMTYTQMRIAVMTLALWTGVTEAMAVEATPPRPNVILFMCDDFSYGDLSCFGQQHFGTPNIDRIANEGTVFTNAYAGGAWCAPSRTSLLTGLRSDHWKNKCPNRPSYPTLGTLFQKAGYATAQFGKWHMKDSPDRNGSLISQRGFDRVLSAFNTPGLISNHQFHFPAEMMSDGKKIVIEKNARAKLSKEYLWNYRKEGGQSVIYDENGNFRDLNGNTDLEYAEHIYRGEAVEFIRKHHDKPFFIYYCPAITHGPLMVKNLGRFKEIEKEDASWTLPRKLWAAMVEETDRSMGAILSELETQGIADNTLIIFTSDNGYSAWGYGLCHGAWTDDEFLKNKGIPADRGKFINSNGGWQVPFIARWPAKMPVSRSSQAVCFYDMMPTFAELAGVKLPWPTDGLNITLLLTGKPEEQPPRPSLFFPVEASFNRWREYEQDNPYDAVLLDERYYAYSIVADGESENPTIRTFDLSVDPGCTSDLAKTQPKLAAQLTKRALEVFRGQSRRNGSPD